MQWINFHIKAHCYFSMYYNTSCCLDHEKGLSSNFSPYMRKCNHVMEHDYNGIGVASCPIYQKADVLESCARSSPSRGVCPVVEQTGLGLLCLSERRRSPKNVCGGGHAVERVFFFLEILLIKPERRRVLSVHIGCVSCGRTDWVGLLMP